MQNTSQFRAFNTIPELIEWLKSNDYVYYHAPMDFRPAFVRVKQYTVNNVQPELNSRCTLVASDCTFVAGLAKHFDRFRLKVTV